MPKELDPRLEGLEAGGQGTATAEEMARRFPEMFGSGYRSPEDIRNIAAESPEFVTGGPGTAPPSGFSPPGQRPPDGTQTIDYNNREGWEKSVFNQIGGNPFDIDPYTYVEQVNAQLPDIFNKVFRGKVIWSDRDKMTKDQANFWNAVVTSVHAQVFDRVTGAKKVMTDKYNWMMNKWDNDAKAKQAALKKLRAGQKAPTSKPLVNKAGELTLHERDPETGKWVDTGMRTAAPVIAKPGKVPQVVTKALEIVQRSAKSISPAMEQLLAMNPEVEKEKWFQDRMNAGADDNMKRLLQVQWDIINAFYGQGPSGEGTVGDAQIAEDIATGKALMTTKGLGSPHKIPDRTFKEKPGTTGKAKTGTAKKAKKGTRIKMDSQGNIIQ